MISCAPISICDPDKYRCTWVSQSRQFWIGQVYSTRTWWVVITCTLLDSLSCMNAVEEVCLTASRAHYTERRIRQRWLWNLELHKSIWGHFKLNMTINMEAMIRYPVSITGYHLWSQNPSDDITTRSVNSACDTVERVQRMLPQIAFWADWTNAIQSKGEKLFGFEPTKYPSLDLAHTLG